MLKSEILLMYPVLAAERAELARRQAAGTGIVNEGFQTGNEIMDGETELGDRYSLRYRLRRVRVTLLPRHRVVNGSSLLQQVQLLT